MKGRIAGMSDDAVLLSREGDIAFVTLNRPDRLNALDKAMWQRLGAVMGELANDTASRCVIVRGKGPAFGAGAEGLASRIVPDDRLEEEARATARRIADGAPLAHRWHKRFVRRLLDPRPLTPAEIAESYAACASADYRTGIQAFLAKEKPRFE